MERAPQAEVTLYSKALSLEGTRRGGTCGWPSKHFQVLSYPKEPGAVPLHPGFIQSLKPQVPSSLPEQYLFPKKERRRALLQGTHALGSSAWASSGGEFHFRLHLGLGLLLMVYSPAVPWDFLTLELFPLCAVLR